MKKLPKKLILNYRNWICGEPSYIGLDCDSRDNIQTTTHGKGNTALLNGNNYYCCLGQFAMQAGCSRKELRLSGEPSQLESIIQGLSKSVKETYPINTKLAEKAMEINDDHNTTVVEKTQKLQKLFKKHGYTIKLKNFPKSILSQLNDFVK